ncbi:MAG: cytochrome c oxidase subunit 3, partial [Cyclobacteriaceae bacterium]|nr:cytochrome c oxidase subunit 3 [Cyclobacteriaceae bacterium]
TGAKKDLLKRVKTGIFLTLILGIAFLIGQFYSWKELISNNVYFTGGNPAESFIYVLTGVHWVHLVSGLIFGLIVTVNTFRFKVHSKSMAQLEMFATYWHFLGALWIYLFFFLMSNHQ